MCLLCVCKRESLLPVGEDLAAVVNTDGQNFISDHFTVVRPTEMLHTHTHAQLLNLYSVLKDKQAKTQTTQISLTFWNKMCDKIILFYHFLSFQS